MRTADGIGRSAIALGADDLPPGWRLVAFETVGSTNDEANRLARDCGAHGTIVTARRQESGRGRRGRAWTSPEGNLFASLILRPAGAGMRSPAQISFVAAVALAETLGALLPPRVAVRTKWPNDILLDGAKSAGILLESEATGGGIDWLVLGVGVNVRHHPESTPYPATSLRAKGAAEVGAGDVLAAFAWRFASWYRCWADEGFAPVRIAWLAHALGQGEAVVVRLDRATIEGRFADLDADGALVLERADGHRQRVSAGDVFFGNLPRGA